MTTFKTIAEAHARITVLEQANAALHDECNVWWEALALAVRKNDALQAEVAHLTALCDDGTEDITKITRDFATQQRERGTAVYRKPR